MSYVVSPSKKPTGYTPSSSTTTSNAIRPTRVGAQATTIAGAGSAAAAAAAAASAAASKAAFNSPKGKKTISVTGSSAVVASSNSIPAATASLNTRFSSTPTRIGSSSATTVAASTSTVSSTVTRQSAPATTTSNQMTATSNSVYADPDSPIASAIRRPQIAANTHATGAVATAGRGGATTASGSTPTLIASASQASHQALQAAAEALERKTITTLDTPSQDLSATTTTKPLSDAATALGYEVEEVTEPVHRYEPLCMAPVRRVLDIVESSSYTRDADGKLVIPPETQQAIYKFVAQQDEIFDPFLFIRSLPPLSRAVPTPRKSPIPKKAADAPNITLALDLDETLVHCSIQHIDNPDLTFNVNFNGVPYEVYVRIRPHLEYFLKQVSKWFEVIVFTASQKVYADTLLDIIDPRNEYISHRVFRDSCVCVEQNFLKDLTILGRQPERVCIVDNSFQAFGFQLDNGIPIESWYDDINDSELLNLVPFLQHLKDVSDVRPYIRQTFRVKDFIQVLPNYYDTGYD